MGNLLKGKARIDMQACFKSNILWKTVAKMYDHFRSTVLWWKKVFNFWKLR